MYYFQKNYFENKNFVNKRKIYDKFENSNYVFMNDVEQNNPPKK